MTVSIELVTFLMLGSLLVLIIMGYPIGLVLGGVATLFGLIFIGPQVLDIFMLRLFGTMSNYILVAVPLFVLMGVVIEKSGIAMRLYDSMYILFGRLRGGLAVATIITCTIFATATGVVGASVVTMGIIALPAMLKYRYDAPLAAGSICAGGTLGILIPPSIMILVYGPTAGVSVGALFSAAFIPGFVLALLYIIYILVISYLNPKVGPAVDTSTVQYTTAEKLKLFFTSVVPVVGLILTVLGAIFFGLASPTEAAALGSAFSLIMAAAYRKLNREVLKEAVMRTLQTSSMVYLVLIGAGFFTGVFMRLGSGDVIKEVILGLPFPDWGLLIAMWLLIVILGMFIDWIGIVMIVVPIFTPIAMELGFDPIWFAMMNIIVLQTSFITPPFAFSIFMLKGVAPPEVTTSHIYRGVVPFILIQLFSLILFSVFPDLILFLPRYFGLL
ncbi:MAG: TRAP transporter large permease subunit [Bacillaceae bacterium]|nr:TRAP transporter large permease subunit [Bacillaceae bacterium]